MESKRVHLVFIVFLLCLLPFSYWLFGREETVGKILERARVARMSGDRDASLEILQEATRKYAKSSTAWMRRGELEAAMGMSEDALESFSRVASTSRLLATRARMLSGTILIQQGRAQEASQNFHEATTLDPRSGEAVEFLRRIWLLQMRREELREVLDLVHEKEPWNVRDLMDYVVAGRYLDLGTSGLNDLQRYCASDTSDLISRVALIEHYRRLSLTEEAHDLAKETFSFLPSELAAGALIEVALDRDDLALAQTVISQMNEVPKSASLWKAAGRYGYMTKQFALAEECLREAMNMDPEDPISAFRLGQVLREFGNEEAEAVMLRATQLEEVFSEVKKLAALLVSDTEKVPDQICRVGDALLVVEQLDLARRSFLTVIQNDPDHIRSQESFAAIKADVTTSGVRDPSTLVVSKLAAKALNITARPDRTIADSQLSFRDVAESVGLDFTYRNGRGEEKYLIQSMGGGVAAVDFDGDRKPDLLYAQGAEAFTPSSLPFRSDIDPEQVIGVSDALYRCDPSGRYVDVTVQAGLKDSSYSLGAIAADFDNDGFMDLLITNVGRCRLYQNQGDGTFREIAAESGCITESVSTSAAWADFDRDGDLDLYIVNYLDSSRTCYDAEGRPIVCHPQNFEAVPDLLFENRGDGTFKNVTEQSGIAVPDGKGLGIVVSDLDLDGYPDVYVANDTTANFLFRNISSQSGIAFEPYGLLSGAGLNEFGQAEAGMGIAIGDLRGSGMMDLYVTNFHSETNTLYRNIGKLDFEDITTSSGMAAATNPRLGFGTQAIDVELDGTLDLFVANGHIDNLEYRGIPYEMAPQLFLNTGGGKFQDVSFRCGGFFQKKHLGRGVARLDWNEDGLEDIVVVHQGTKTSLLENRSAPQGSWLKVRFVGSTSNRDAINVRCKFMFGDTVLVREISGGDGYLSTNERVLNVGVPVGKLDRIEIHWPSGFVDSFDNIESNRQYLAVEGVGGPGTLISDN